jgi:hypothetical protein
MQHARSEATNRRKARRPPREHSFGPEGHALSRYARMAMGGPRRKLSRRIGTNPRTHDRITRCPDPLALIYGCAGHNLL